MESFSAATPVALQDRSPTWRMPAEDVRHDRTWMCWPSSKGIWGRDLSDVQESIAVVAETVAAFEPVTMVLRPAERRRVRARLPGVQLLDGPVDDLWARDTLPNFVLTRERGRPSRLAASHARFNGWGGKQTHSGDAQLAALVAAELRFELHDSGLVGEGGGIEVDGEGTVLAARSSWVNKNRNPGKIRTQIEVAVLRMLGADRMIWVDGAAGLDITDGHIDTRSHRSVDPGRRQDEGPGDCGTNACWSRISHCRNRSTDIDTTIR
jgi:agmatine deiminase